MSNQAEINVYVNNVDELIIWDLMESKGYTFMLPEQLTDVIFTTMGLYSPDPDFMDGGIKVRKKYFHNSDLAISKEFKYHESHPERGMGVEIDFYWHYKDDNGDSQIGLHKKEFASKSLVEFGNIRKKQRERAISFLSSSAKGTPIEPFVNALLTRYSNYSVDTFTIDAIDHEVQGDLISHFERNNSEYFLHAVQTESLSPFLNYLDIDVHPDPNIVKRVRDSIEAQLLAHKNL